jgi:hypothetical protein
MSKGVPGKVALKGGLELERGHSSRNMCQVTGMREEAGSTWLETEREEGGQRRWAET